MVGTMMIGQAKMKMALNLLDNPIHRQEMVMVQLLKVLQEMLTALPSEQQDLLRVIEQKAAL